jgi:hypothetical protein
MTELGQSPRARPGNIGLFVLAAERTARGNARSHRRRP